MIVVISSILGAIVGSMICGENWTVCVGVGINGRNVLNPAGFVYLITGAAVGAFIGFICMKIINSSNNKDNSKVDELKKLKDLFDNGAITEEEYNIQKDILLKSKN